MFSVIIRHIFGPLPKACGCKQKNTNALSANRCTTPVRRTTPAQPATPTQGPEPVQLTTPALPATPAPDMTSAQPATPTQGTLTVLVTDEMRVQLNARFHDNLIDLTDEGMGPVTDWQTIIAKTVDKTFTEVAGHGLDITSVQKQLINNLIQHEKIGHTRQHLMAVFSRIIRGAPPAQ